MTHLNLIFENSDKFYFEGEKVRVKLEVNLENATTVNSLTGTFDGVGVCLLREGRQSSMGLSKFFTKNLTEVYFGHAQPLFVAENVTARNWSPGVHVFMLEYQLPHSLPSSFESFDGYIRYSVQVNADFEKEVIKKTEYFTVVAKIDLNKNVSAYLPGVSWKPEHECFLEALFCNRGSVRAFVHIPKRGYVPGESMFINAEVCNFSRFPIEWVKASLIQVVKYCDLKSFKVKRIVIEITRGCILPYETQIWRSERMLIPAIPPTSHTSKKHINVKYRLSFQYKASWQQKVTELEQKILIGSVQSLDPGQGREQCQGEGEGEGVHSSELFNGSNLEPCVFGPHPVGEDGSYSTFSPVYPVYVVM